MKNWFIRWGIFSMGAITFCIGWGIGVGVGADRWALPWQYVTIGGAGLGFIGALWRVIYFSFYEEQNVTP
jgi:hypothetical protein